MNADAARTNSLRPGRPELTRLGWAVALSLIIHLLGYGGYEVGKRTGLGQALRLPAWLQNSRLLATFKQAQEEKPPEMPLVYVDVSPHQQSAEPPKDAKFYSNLNSQAANPDANKESEMPKITGTQTQVIKTEDTPRGPLSQLQPKIKAEREDTEFKPPVPVGDLAMFKPDPNQRPADKVEEPKPRTIKEALQRQGRTQRVGEKMKSEGGVNRRVEMTSLDAKASPLGDYDAEFIEIVQSRWYDLLDNISYEGYRRGKVQVEFRLHYDGQITDLKVVDENVGSMLSLMCQKAVSDPAPFRKWDREMRLSLDKDYRELKFTFYYN